MMKQNKNLISGSYDLKDDNQVPKRWRIETTDKYPHCCYQKLLFPKPKKEFCLAIGFLSEGSGLSYPQVFFQLVEYVSSLLNWQLTVSIKLPGHLILNE